MFLVVLDLLIDVLLFQLKKLVGCFLVVVYVFVVMKGFILCSYTTTFNKKMLSNLLETLQ